MIQTTFDSGKWIKYLFLATILIVVATSFYISNKMAKKLANEERQKMEVWGDATKTAIKPNQNTDMSLVLKIIEGNKSIPVILCDASDNILTCKNISFSQKDSLIYLKKKLKEFKHQNNIITINLGNDLQQRIYYGDSILLKQLHFLPIIQIIVACSFLSVLFLAFLSIKKSEQDKIWIGLSKETAHQLGTPISSLWAWLEYLKSCNIDSSILNEIEKDIVRLQTVAERFSKIGSQPKSNITDLSEIVQTATSYMQKRVSKRISIKTIQTNEKPFFSKADRILLLWVFENLIKNGVDAITDKGEINIQLNQNERDLIIDIHDTGKGLPKSKYKTIFNPGYTTKERGWGLGLSLTKRIIETYHKGKIFVKNSEIGKGTTIRIVLKKANKNND